MIRSVPNLTRSLRLAAALLGASAALGACTHTDQQSDITTAIPTDYRQRHPIVIQEANRSTEVFVGSGRGGQTWMREGTGGIVIDMPVGTPNARAATTSLHEIRSLLTAVGVPAHGITVRNYRPADPRQFATIRVNYPRIQADAGPCGLWPEDLGPSIKNKGYLDNRPYYNLGCATQRNLAAMVDNPSDLVQPRAETPPMTMRRNITFDKYRKGTTTATAYPEGEKAKLSDIGK
jgi:pilus assembly protein CpaD